jgi:hypothetical protein
MVSSFLFSAWNNNVLKVQNSCNSKSLRRLSKEMKETAVFLDCPAGLILSSRLTQWRHVSYCAALRSESCDVMNVQVNEAATHNRNVPNICKIRGSVDCETALQQFSYFNFSSQHFEFRHVV